jgi:alginate O-acetyltransferase complex protein AlgI
LELIHILIFAVFAIPYALIVPASSRGWVLFAVSAIAIYWLQPTLDIRWLDYSLPTLTLSIAVVCWWVTRPKDSVTTRDDWLALAFLFVLLLALTIPRYVDVPLTLTSRPPPIETVIIGMATAFAVALGLRSAKPSISTGVAIGAILLAFAAIKTEPLATAISGLLRLQARQDASLAKAVDLGWLGFSYVAFRLIHTLRDRQIGILPALSLREYVTYVIFFPAFTAGPIDRAERFVEDSRGLTTLQTRDPNRWVQGIARILIGMVKKFAIADSLAALSLSAITAGQAESPLALWGMLYALAFRLYFDFSGYSDIVIGIGILFGVKLPENFDRPYLKQNLSAFWQSWHITLSTWARAYVYTPLSKVLLRRKASTNVAVLICSAATMSVVGLWHGVTVPFLIWGLWHGLGLFVHQVWSERTRKWYRGLKDKPRQKIAWHVAGILLTFHFVLLGWVWFALPEFSSATQTFARLFGWWR